MKTQRLRILVLCFAAFSFDTFAVEAPPLTLDEVKNSVQKFYPLVISAQKDLEKSEGEFLSAQGGFDPVLKANATDVPVGYYQNHYFETTLEQPTPLWGTRLYATWRTGQGNFAVYDGRLLTYNGGEIKGGIDLPLLRNGSIDERRAKIQISEKGIQVATASMTSQRLDFIRQATQKYWDWVSAGRKLKVAQDLLDIANERNKALLHRVHHGDAAPIEQTENQRALVQRQSALMGAERYLQKTTFELSIYFRDNQGNPILVSPNRLPEFPEPEETEKNESSTSAADLQLIVSRHPDIKRFGFQMEQIQVDLEYSKNQILPRLDFYLGGSMDLGKPTDPTLSSAYIQPTYASEVRVGVQFELPLFLRTARGKAAANQAAIERLEAQNTLTRDRIRTNIMDTLQAMETSKKRAALANKEVELARKLENGERIRFQHGDSNLLIVNLREQITVDAEIREIEALLEYYRGKADYQFAIAQLES